MFIMSHLDVTNYLSIAGNQPWSQYPAYSSSNAYAINARVFNSATKKDYRASQAVPAGATYAPATPGGLAYWQEIGYANFWKPFDQGSLSAVQGVTGTPLYYTVEPNLTVADTVALFNVVGRTAYCRLLDEQDNVLWAQGYAIPNALQSDWYGYGFSPGDGINNDMNQEKVLFTGVPFVGGRGLRIRVIVDPHEATNQASLGVMSVGSAFQVGTTLEGAKMSLVDYSRKEVDEFGAVDLVPRGFSFTSEYPLAMPRSRAGAASRVMAAYRNRFVTAFPSYEENDPVSLERRTHLMNFGLLRDFEIEFEASEYAYANVTVEGVA